jgi:NAD(P)H-flavin reductase
VFVQAPFCSRIQWHPFTISSAPEEKSVTLHIRVQDPGSWTHQLKLMFEQMAPKGTSYIKLDRMTAQGKMPGKILGPDGKQMIRIDGPHSVTPIC